jgi:hypothetical protein
MVDLPLFDGARNWATQGVINYFEIFSRRVAASSNNSKKAYEYLHLVENVRTEKGPRQRLILNLGALTLEAEQ